MAAGLEVGFMEWDLGIQGVGLVLAMAVVFGFVVELLWGRAHWPWLWPTATMSGFLIGLLVSEVWFGWATEEELQPNVDGVSFDEVLLGLVLTALAVFAVRLITRRRRRPWIGWIGTGGRSAGVGHGSRPRQ
jgi:hypothetical protein